MFEGSFLRAKLFLPWYTACSVLLLLIPVVPVSLLLVPVAVLL